MFGKSNPKRKKDLSISQVVFLVLGGMATFVCLLGCLFLYLFSQPFPDDYTASATVVTASDQKATPQPIATLKLTRTPKPTAIPTLEPVGRSRSNPVPWGQTAVGGGMNIAVTEVLRPANDKIHAACKYNDPPDEGHEYVMIYVMAECTLSSEHDEQCSFDDYEFELTGSTNLVRRHEYVSDVPERLDDVEFYSGATVTGALIFQVAQGEENLILIYEPIWSFLFDNEIFFEIQ